jgi:hypothetical protein
VAESRPIDIAIPEQKNQLSSQMPRLPAFVRDFSQLNRFLSHSGFPHSVGQIGDKTALLPELAGVLRIANAPHL